MYKELFDLSNKRAAVLGGGGGIGSRIVRGMLEFGARVVAVEHKVSIAEESLCEEIKEFRDRLFCYGADVTSKEQVTGIGTFCRENMGGLDILVNCVGGNKPAATTDEERDFFALDTDAIRSVVDLNLFAGGILPAQVLGKDMVKEKDGGSIILISSMSADRPLTRIPGYSAAKAAIDSFTRWLAVDLARNFNRKLRVNAVAPGFFHTKQNDFLLYGRDRKLTPRGRDIINGTPMARFGKLEEIVGAVLWLCSDAAKFVSGTVIPVDGGFSAFSGV